MALNIKSSSSTTAPFTGATEISQVGASSVPSSYVLPPVCRPNLGPTRLITNPELLLPPIDLSLSHQPDKKLCIMEQIRYACKEFGIFQVINHGIPPAVMSGALDAATKFFGLPKEEKVVLASGNVHEPVRYGTSLNHVKDKFMYWRDFIKHYSNPIATWIDAWPSNPPTYKKKMGDYAQAVHMLHKQMMEIVFESLGLSPSYLSKEVDTGSQVMAVNCYPKCPEPELVLGIPPHTDYGYMTILLQSEQGLEVVDKDEKWFKIPVQEGALVVQMGDQGEIISNGRYVSPAHRAVVNSNSTRVSVVSLHSLALHQKVEPAPELVNVEHPALYKQGSFSQFLDFITENDVMEQRYLDSLKIIHE